MNWLDMISSFLLILIAWMVLVFVACVIVKWMF